MSTPHDSDDVDDTSSTGGGGDDATDASAADAGDASESTSEADDSEPTCRCGFGVDHHFVSPRLKYSIGGWLWMFMGVNSMPTEVRFVCHQCDEVVYVTTDPDELEKHRMGGR